MKDMVKSFQELTPEFQTFAGGKGGMLIQRGLIRIAYCYSRLHVESTHYFLT